MWVGKRPCEAETAGSTGQINALLPRWGACREQRKGTEMVRFCGVLFLAGLLAGKVAFPQAAQAQCRGGTGQGTTGTTGTTATTTAALARTAGLNGGANLLTSPGSLAYDMMLQQAFATQMA